MALAFVLLNCRPDSAKVVVLDELYRIAGVTDAKLLSGAYDIIVKVEANSIEQVKSAVMKIRRVEAVSSSLTLVQTN
jgi:DNA-binding Lrp family transcriptional regulator